MRAWDRVGGWCTYIVECADGTLYTGISNRLSFRIDKHNEGRASKYTRARLPVKLVWFRVCTDRSHASIVEAQIKKMSRTRKKDMIKRVSSTTGVPCEDRM